MKKLVASMIAAMCSLSVLNAAAEDTENDEARIAAGPSLWSMSSVENRRGEPWGSALMTTAENGRAVGFRCLDGKLLAAFGLEETDMMRAFTAAGPQKAVRFDVTVNGAETETQNWILLRRHKVVASGDQKMARRLYNAVVRGESVTIDGRAGRGEYIMPPPDPKAFASFMEACGFSAKEKK